MGAESEVWNWGWVMRGIIRESVEGVLEWVSMSVCLKSNKKGRELHKYDEIALSTCPIAKLRRFGVTGWSF